MKLEDIHNPYLRAFLTMVCNYLLDRSFMREVVLANEKVH